MIGENVPERLLTARAELEDYVQQYLAKGGHVTMCTPAGDQPRPVRRVASDDRSVLLEQARQAAKTMTLNDAFQTLGVSRTLLHQLAKAGGFQFRRHDKERVRRAQARQQRDIERQQLVDKLRAYATTSLTRAEVGNILKISQHLLIRLVRENDIHFPRRT